MSDKFQDTYRIPSARAEWWDYNRNAAYFITICTQGRKHYFGEIIDLKMNLSNIGVLADVFWYEIKNHAHEIELGSFVVMPNHIHGILILNGNDNNHGNHIGGDIETRHALSLQPSEPEPTIAQKRFQNQGKNTISSIVGSYKSAVSKHAHRLGFEFIWQSRFYDHIIRDEDEYQRIAQYIETNPENWNTDQLNNG